jgi:uncharacterized protein (DUF1778 family)
MATKTVNVSARLEPEEYDALRARAAAEGRPLSNLMRFLVRQGLGLKQGTPRG